MRRVLMGLMALAILTGLTFTRVVQALSSPISVKLTDTISKGIGDINLLKNIDAAQLEAYRATYGSRAGIAFGVDVNEAANGTEKASSQGVTVADAWLEVVIGGVTKTYGHSGNFYTETQALLAPAGATARSSYYTLLGETGSARITSNSSIQKTFDSTLKIVVPDSLAGASSAVLHVRLLNTNAKLGDPEAFYSFSAGFEDVAILVPADAKYLDEVAPTETTFRSEAPAAELSPEGVATQTTLLASSTPPPPTSSLSWIQMPGASSYNIVAYEDFFPARGDYDFNDVVVAYRYQLGINSNGQVERIDGVAYLIARGSTYTHDWTLDIALPPAVSAGAINGCSTVNAGSVPLPCSVAVGNGRLRWTAFSDTVAAFPGPGAIPVNTPAGSSPTLGPKATFSVSLATPVDLASVGIDDPWILVRNTAKEVHLSDRDSNAYPYAMLLPSAWKIPVEYTDMGLSYPGLSTFVGSAGRTATDWYLHPVNSLVKNWAVSNWAW